MIAKFRDRSGCSPARARVEPWRGDLGKAGDFQLARIGRILTLMTPQSELGKLLVVLGLVMVCVGLVLWSGVGKGWLGRLPGDISYTRGNFSFHFPVVTCILLSVVLTVLMWLFRR